MARSPKAVGLPCTLWHTQWWRCRRARRSRNRAEWKTASVPSSWALVEELEGFCIKKMSQNINLFSFDREITNGQACIIHWHTCNYRISDVQGKMDWNTTGVLFKHLSKHNIFVGLFVMLPKCIMQGIFSLSLSFSLWKIIAKKFISKENYHKVHLQQHKIWITAQSKASIHKDYDILQYKKEYNFSSAYLISELNALRIIRKMNTPASRLMNREAAFSSIYSKP